MISESSRKRKRDQAIPTAGSASTTAGGVSVATGSTSTISPKFAGKLPAKRQKSDHERKCSELTETAELELDSESDSLLSLSDSGSELDEDTTYSTPPPQINDQQPGVFSFFSFSFINICLGVMFAILWLVSGYFRVSFAIECVYNCEGGLFLHRFSVISRIVSQF